MDTITRDKLLAVAAEYDRLTKSMATPEVAVNPESYRRLAKAQAQISELVRCFRRFDAEERRLEEAERLLREEKDEELRQLAEEEKELLTASVAGLEQQIKLLLVPQDPNDDKNTILEIRAGTGGEEAGLFVGDLFRMYSRYAESKGWKVETISASPTELGGYKEICFQITGDKVYSQMKWEGGVHRVQRVPQTEAQGRIHTSAVTVAVLPEAEEVDVVINPEEVHFDVYRSSGPGGQSVNTTDSAVRLTHKPTGIVITIQDEKSQHKNKAKALKVLRSRLLALKEEEEAAARSETRRSQVRSGDRSEKVRTYNFPQNRVTDHRINFTQHNLDRVIEGELQTIINALVAADRAAKLAAPV